MNGVIRGSAALLFLVVIVTGFVPGCTGCHSSESITNDCRRNLDLIGFALLNYRDEHGEYPPVCVRGENGEPMHSWRILLLPYLGEKELFDRYDFTQPWDSKRNQFVLNAMPSVYRCPTGNSDSGMTSYVAVTDADGGWLTPQVDSKKIRVIEISDSNIAWAEPHDIVLEAGREVPTTDQLGPQGKHSKGAIRMSEKSGGFEVEATGY